MRFFEFAGAQASIPRLAAGRFANVLQGVRERFRAPFLTGDFEKVADDLEFEPDGVFSASGRPAFVPILCEVRATQVRQRSMRQAVVDPALDTSVFLIGVALLRDDFSPVPSSASRSEVRSASVRSIDAPLSISDSTLRAHCCACCLVSNER